MKSRSHDDLAAKGLFCGESCVSILFVLSSGNSFYGIICALKVDSQGDCFLELSFLWLDCGINFSLCIHIGV